MYDLLIRGGMLVDGSGGEPFPADLAVRDGKIARIAPHIEEEAGRVLSAEGCHVTPGFIDIHRHSDAFVLKEGFGELQLRQGITTTVNGNCGLSIVPRPSRYRGEIDSYLKPIIGTAPGDMEFTGFSEYLRAVEKRRLPINFGMLIGNGTLRMAAKGFARGRLSGEEVSVAQGYLSDALENGAFGISMGLAYMPENMYDIDGIVEVLRPAGGSGLPLVTHIRGEGALLVESLQEVITIAKRLKLPLHISHFKCIGKDNWGHLLKKALETLDAARQEGLEVSCDVYPYTAGSTQLCQMLPPEFLEGGTAATARRLRDGEERGRCREILEHKQTRFENMLLAVGWDAVMVTSVQSEKNQRYVGLRIPEIAAMQGKDPYDCAFDLLAEENCEVAMVDFIACEDDIETILRSPHSSVISDSVYPDGGLPHPRQYGNFPRLLCAYVRDKPVLSLPQAIHKMTYGPAQVLSIPNKGLLREGFDADIAVFHLGKLRDRATYTDPRRFPTGFSYVLVSGEIANDHDRFLPDSAGGRVLRRK